MCRLLFVQSDNKINIEDHLEQFSRIAENSREFQGHGWGCAYLKNDQWQIYKNIQPIWNDDLSSFGTTHRLIAHVRSAFRDEDIAVENNMPFQNGEWIYIFNGELHGVRIKEQGRSGAAKIFNYIMRFYDGDMQKTISKAITIIQKRSKYIRAANLIIANKSDAYLYSLFNQDGDYFTLHYSKDGITTIICSEPFDDQNSWKLINNNSLKEF